MKERMVVGGESCKIAAISWNYFQFVRIFLLSNVELDETKL